MSYLDKISVPKDDPLICTITGDAGIGKTTLGASFPKPVFIQAEKGLKSIPFDIRPPAMPMITSVDMLWEQIRELINDEHDFKTVVIDSVTKLDNLFESHCLKVDQERRAAAKKPIPDTLTQAYGGYQAGWFELARYHRRLRAGAEALREKRGMNVVFIAHSETSRVDPPDGEPYSRYELKLNKHSYSAYIDDVDLVGYLKQEAFFRGEGKTKKATGSGRVIMIAYSTAANISKNRLHITNDVIVNEGENPIAEYYPLLKEQETQA